MTNKTIFSLLVTISLVVLPFYTFARLSVGGSTPITNVRDPHVVAIGKFAVSEYDREHKTELKFEKVVRGTVQLVEGKKYWLTVAAKDGAESKNYEVQVWEKPWLKSMNLTLFKPVS